MEAKPEGNEEEKKLNPKAMITYKRPTPQLEKS